MKRRTGRAIALAALAIALLAPSLARADFPQPRITHFGADGDLTQEAGFTTAAYNSQTNQYLVAYLAGPSGDTHHWTVYGQMVDAAGSAVGGQLTISAPTGNDICEDDPPNITYSAALNQFMVSWNEGAAGNCDDAIYVQRIGADGTLLGTPSERISATGFDDIETSEVVYNPAANEWLVAWKGDAPTTSDQELFAQRLSADGSEVGVDDKQLTDFKTPGGNANDAMAVAVDPVDSRYLVVVRGVDPTVVAGGRYETYAHLMTSDLTTIGPDHIRVSHIADTNASGDSNPPNVGYDSVNNRFLVAWTGDPKIGSMVDNERDVFARLVDKDGNVLGSDDTRLSDMGPDGSTAYGPQRPDVGFNPNAKEFFLAWSGDDDTAPQVDNESEVWGQRVAADGTEVGPNDFRVSHYGTDGDTSSAANRPALAFNTSNCQFLAAWQSGDVGSFGGASDEWDVYANIVDAPCPPVNAAVPQITGTAQQGQTLTTSDGKWSGRGMAFTYQWLNSGQPIAGATSSTYVPTAGDVNHSISARVTATDPDGTASADSAAVSPVASPVIAPPVVKDTTPPVCKPSVAKQKLAAVLKKGLKVGVSCNEAAKVSAVLILPSKVVKGLHAAKALTVGKATGRISKAGRFTITIKLTKKAKKLLAKAKSVKATLRTTATDSVGNRAKTRSTTLKLKR